MNQKPVILLCGRIHPGEVPASHAMNGILQFLLNTKDARAYLLRSLFIFKIIPMLNPDGVYHGFYRKDTRQENLNRHYMAPDPEFQPQCYALLELAEQFAKDNTLFMFIDIHAHSSNKSCFVYGNAHNDFIAQIENNLFTKLISLNTLNFDHDQCNFSEKQMIAIDRNEQLSKENSARVQMLKKFELVHSYTLECGFHSPINFFSQQKLVEPTNSSLEIEFISFKL